MCNKEKSNQCGKPIDIQIFRSDLVAMCVQILNNIEPFSLVDEFEPMMKYMNTSDKQYFQKLFALHNDLVYWILEKQSLLLKAETIQQLYTLYWQISNGLKKKQEQLNHLVRESIKDSRHNLDKIRSRCGFIPS